MMNEIGIFLAYRGLGWGGRHRSLPAQGERQERKRRDDAAGSDERIRRLPSTRQRQASQETSGATGSSRSATGPS